MDEGRKASMEPKLFNDPIHGSIEIPAFCAKIIDTPEFQFLRGIKQLGGCSYVYPAGVHTRFDHSIGLTNSRRTLNYYKNSNGQAVLNSQIPVHRNLIHINSIQSARRNIHTKLQGKRIKHKWIVYDIQQWYRATVVSIASGRDGIDAVYEVVYDNDDELQEIDHLIEDFRIVK